ncbi:putative lyase [Medicago truncatula]|uniref:(E)-beta-ocimene synthase n=1 Tax=Medicago truncatula TaxID=3880 RepID=A0A396IKC5_MEDTR|nr:(-)-germacrene D synthase-like [Medicago truncatula]RHN65690.1 putative lyase [Medicago truncatula]
MSSTEVAKSDLHRNVADYQPDIWGDYFLQYASEYMELDQNIGSKIETLKNDVRNMLVSNTEKTLAKIHLIDSIYRLGVSYHFEQEIEEVLHGIHKNYVVNGEITLEDHNLSSLAVLFRLLRQQGLHVLPNVFNKFKDELGNFSEKLIKNVEGMLSLYEATHIMVHGEDILEEALAFTTTQLESISKQSSHSHALQAKHCLRQTLHKNIPRLEARSYISRYEEDPSHNENLLILAKLDFNMLQSLHQKEFGNFSKWWKELDVRSKLPYARDRIAESCFWALGVYYEPQYSTARKVMTKLFVIITVIDDTYDAFGRIDELELFTKALERWDISCLDNLPDYMKFLYVIILDLYKEIEQEMKKEGREYALNYYVKEFIKYVQAYMTEARWLNDKYQPTLEEYIRISTESCGYALVTTTCYIFMGDTATEDIFKWVSNGPKMINAAIILCRLMDDIASNEFEQKRDHVSSFLECYMKQHNISREGAIQEGRKRIVDAWKDMNKECLMPTEIPIPFLTCILNLSRFMDVVYKDKDNFTHPEGEMKTFIKSLLVDPVPI